jgi:hypothetical protein
MHRFADWWSNTSPAGKITMITSLIIGVTGAIIGMQHVSPIVADYWYVAQYELRMVADQQARATDRQTLFQLQQFLATAKKDPNAAKSPTAQEYIRKLEADIADTERRINGATPPRK